MKKSKKILLKWAATYGEDESDVKASMYNEDMMIEFAKYYHKQKLTLNDVVKPLNDEGQATLTEYATELINMQENPQDSNKDWKIVVMQNTIVKLHETIKSL
jgi:hypothetical protein